MASPPVRFEPNRLIDYLFIRVSSRGKPSSESSADYSGIESGCFVWTNSCDVGGRPGPARLDLSYRPAHSIPALAGKSTKFFDVASNKVGKIARSSSDHVLLITGRKRRCRPVYLVCRRGRASVAGSGLAGRRNDTDGARDRHESHVSNNAGSGDR